MIDAAGTSGGADGGVVSPELITVLVPGAWGSVISGVIDGKSVLSLATTVLFVGGSATGTVDGLDGATSGALGCIEGWVVSFGAAGAGAAGVITPVGGGVSAGCLLPPIIIRNASNSPTVSSWLHYMFMYFHHTLYA